MWGFSGLAEKLLVFQERLCSLKLDILLICYYKCCNLKENRRWCKRGTIMGTLHKVIILEFLWKIEEVEKKRDKQSSGKR